MSNAEKARKPLYEPGPGGTIQVPMQTCNNCQHKNGAASLFCSQCGHDLGHTWSTNSGPVTIYRRADLLATNISAPQFRRDEHYLRGTQIFPSGGYLRLEVVTEDNKPTQPMILEVKREAILGRFDARVPMPPDADFTLFDGYRLGVSRNHAKVSISSEGYLYLTDLGSSNGTYLNGERLPVQKPHALHDGDEIRLGNLKMQCFFHC